MKFFPFARQNIITYTQNMSEKEACLKNDLEAKNF
jgi:hypothetical protein